MPQPKSSGARKPAAKKPAAAAKKPAAAAAAKKPAAKKPAARKPAARKPAAAAAKPAARTSATAKPAARSAAAKKPAARKPAARKPAAAKPTSRAAAASDAVQVNLQQLRDLILLSRERLQEALDEVVERGHIDRAQANKLVQELVKRSRKQTDDLLAEIDQLVGKGRAQAKKTTTRAVRSKPGDQILRTVDKGRRAVGATFPISGYHDLNATQITSRLSDLTAAQLRKVRDFEAKNSNRKSIIAAIEKRLGR